MSSLGRFGTQTPTPACKSLIGEIGESCICISWEIHVLDTQNSPCCSFDSSQMMILMSIQTQTDPERNQFPEKWGLKMKMNVTPCLWSWGRASRVDFWAREHPTPSVLLALKLDYSLQLISVKTGSREKAAPGLLHRWKRWSWPHGICHTTQGRRRHSAQTSHHRKTQLSSSIQYESS